MAKPTEKPLEKIVKLPTSQILVQNDWNGRTVDWKGIKLKQPELKLDGKEPKDDGSPVLDDQPTRFHELLASIRKVGQDDAVDVRPNTDPKTKKRYPWVLMAGFQRYHAILMIAAERKIKDPTIKCIVRDVDSLEARRRNIRENASRENLTVPDLSWSVHQLWLESGKRMASTEIAKDIGKAQTYVSRMLVIMEKMPTAATEDWRRTGGLVPYKKMYSIAKACETAQERQTAYHAAVKSLSGGSATAKKPGKIAKKLEQSTQKLEEFARVLGLLERLKLIDTSKLDFEEHILVLEEAGLVAFAEGTSPAQKKQVGREAMKAWRLSMAEKPNGESHAAAVAAAN